MSVAECRNAEAMSLLADAAFVDAVKGSVDKVISVVD